MAAELSLPSNWINGHQIGTMAAELIATKLDQWLSD
jgi:hypothetical protein